MESRECARPGCAIVLSGADLGGRRFCLQHPSMFPPAAGGAGVRRDAPVAGVSGVMGRGVVGRMTDVGPGPVQLPRRSVSGVSVDSIAAAAAAAAATCTTAAATASTAAGVRSPPPLSSGGGGGGASVVVGVLGQKHVLKDNTYCFNQMWTQVFEH